MAIVAVQRKGKGALAVTTLSIGSGDGWATPAAGNVLVVTANSDATVSTPTGYTAGPSVVDGNGAYIFWKISDGTESTVTVTPGSAANTTMTACEYSGLSGIPLDVSNSSTISGSAGTTTTSVSVTTTQPGDLVIAAALIHSGIGGTAATGPSWTNSFVNQVSATTGNASPTCDSFVAELVVGAAGAYSTSASWTNSANDRQELVISFKAAQVTEVGTTTYKSVNTATVTTASFTPADNTLLVAYCSMGNGAGSSSSLGTVTDSLSGSWTRLAGDASTTGGVAEVWCRDIATAASMTVTYDPGGAGASGVDIICKWYSGAAPKASQPGATATLGGGTAYTKAITTTTTGSLVAGAYGRATDSQTLTANSSTTILGQVNGTSGDTACLFRATTTTGSSPGSITLGFTNAASGANRMALAEILPTLPATLTYPPQRPLTRRPVPLRVARSRQTVPVRAQVNPPVPVQEIRPTRQLRGYLIRRGKLAQTIPPQFNPPYPFVEVVQPRRLRGLLPRRGKTASAPPQLDQSFPWSEIAQPRRLRGLLPRRGRQSQPVSGQVVVTAPAYPPQTLRSRAKTYRLFRGRQAQVVPAQDQPVVESVQARRQRGMPVRRGRYWLPVPPQFNPPYPWSEIVQPRRLRGLLLRRGKTASAPPQLDQLAPVQESAQPRRLRGILLRRGKLAQTVPPQFNPPFPFAEVVQPRRARGLLARRGRIAQPVPGQIVLTAPAYVPQTLRSRMKAYRLFRGRQAQPVPAQQAAPASPVFVPGRTRPRLRLAALRRGHLAVPLPAQDIPVQLRPARRVCPVHGRPRLAAPAPAQAAPVPVKVARRPLLGMLRRGAKALLPLKQAVPPAPPVFVPGPGRRRLMFLPARRGHQAAPPAVCECITHRPETGTTTRPATGTTAYATATTGRPSTGTTARPDTGTTKDPCC